MATKLDSTPSKLYSGTAVIRRNAEGKPETSLLVLGGTSHDQPQVYLSPNGLPDLGNFKVIPPPQPVTDTKVRVTTAKSSFAAPAPQRHPLRSLHHALHRAEKHEVSRMKAHRALPVVPEAPAPTSPEAERSSLPPGLTLKLEVIPGVHTSEELWKSILSRAASGTLPPNMLGRFKKLQTLSEDAAQAETDGNLEVAAMLHDRFDAALDDAIEAIGAKSNLELFVEGKRDTLNGDS
jgi:hypothetical protein